MSAKPDFPRAETSTHPDFLAIAEQAPAMIRVAGADKLCYWFNKRWLDFTGRSMEQERGNGWSEGVHPDDLAHCVDEYARYFAGREHLLLEYRLRRHTGEYRLILESGSPRFDTRGNFLGYNAVCFDINHSNQSEELQASQSKFINAVLDCEPECVKVVAPDGSLVMMNRAGLDILEVATLEEAKSLGLEHFIALEHRKAFNELHKCVIAGGQGTLEFELIGNKGTRRWLETHAAPLRDKTGSVVSLIGITRDVTERRALLSRLEQQSHTDKLTGLHNRGHFCSLTELELARVGRYGGTLSMLMFDIDGFKEIDDRYGQKAGDLVLIGLAETCRATLREMDIAGRLGGEEFAILLPETDGPKAIEAAQRLRLAIAANQTELPDGSSLAITASFGVTSVDGRQIDLDALMHELDAALEDAKSAGRNRIFAFDRQAVAQLSVA